MGGSSAGHGPIARASTLSKFIFSLLPAAAAWGALHLCSARAPLLPVLPRNLPPARSARETSPLIPRTIRGKPPHLPQDDVTLQPARCKHQVRGAPHKARKTPPAIPRNHPWQCHLTCHRMTSRSSPHDANIEYAEHHTNPYTAFWWWLHVLMTCGGGERHAGRLWDGSGASRCQAWPQPCLAGRREDEMQDACTHPRSRKVLAE